MAGSEQSTSPQSAKRSFGDRVRGGASLVLHHAKKHTGVGIVCAVAYFDPGNWGVDLQAGSQFGYHLLFIVLLAGLIAVFYQVLASRLGCVTGLDLASHSRLLLYNRPKHTLLYRWLGLYPLYMLAEIAIVATDLAELLGSAIALCLLFPKLELWHGVLLTATDVIFILAMGDPLRGKPVKMFELLIAALVLAVLISMVIVISKVEVDWAQAFDGFVPSKHIFASGGVYTSVGIIGATVMPHSLFLGSALATQDRVSFRETHETELQKVESKDSTDELLEEKSEKPPSLIHKFFLDCKESILAAFRTPSPSDYSKGVDTYADHVNNAYEFVRAHIYHATFDMVGSLLGFAVIINSLILILASAVFYYQNPNPGSTSPASLFDAYDLIRDSVGKPAATIFAIALLCSGQSSSIIATVAGQAVCEGFIRWRVSPIMRRLVTRLLAIIPSVIVAIAVGRNGVDTLLIASQVVLSFVLPFITLPLLWCTSSKAIMTVKKTRLIDPPRISTTTTVEVEVVQISEKPLSSSCPAPSIVSSHGGEDTGAAELGEAQEEVVDYSNNKLTIGLGTVIWLVIAAANVYAIVELGINPSNA
ncbi:natural resistance-associated macrophage protein-domain-containing protein [Crepidotus variabilis]|uniref:Natural resistance-associated macrophage protein-domain-containing protein n=1 Tax=Crepidotus variabilis TaxID=179855 RepID=A0A9P6EFE4_9AGAR|nr:natural resistance-associated macrophage protein-domain-containing protein [Crepidotus variabilis]